MEPQIKQTDLLPLSAQEMELLFLIRHRHRYGSIEIVTHDGKPVDVIRTTDRNRLGKWEQ